MANRITRVSLVASVGAFQKDVRDGKREVTGLRQEAERFSKGRYEASIKADTAGARTELSALEKRLKAFAATPIDQRVNLDTDEARQRLTALQGRMTDLGSRVTDARVDVDDAEAAGKLSRIEASLLRLGRMSADPDIDLTGIAAAEADLATLTRQLGAFDGEDYRAQVHVNGTLAATRQASMLIDMLAMLGPAVVPMIAATTPALAGLTSGLAAAGVGAGVTALAFSGVGDALDALNDSQVAAGANAQESARTQVQASQQIADARRGLVDAQRAAAQSAQDSADRIADAQRGIADAHRDAARSARDSAEQVQDARRGLVRAERDAADAAKQGARDIIEAQERVAEARRDAAETARDSASRVADAEERLADSHRRVEDALADLHEARQQAMRDLDDLRERTEDNALTIEGAEIGLLRARERLAKTSADAEATDLDLREARLRVAEAEDRLADAHRRSAEDQAALTAAEEAGIDGSRRVVDARDRITEANEGVRDAEQSLADVQRDAARAQKESAQQIAEAIEDLVSTRERATDRNRRANQQVVDAERSLARATRDAAESRADAARQIEDAQRQLSEAQQDAARSRADAARRIERAEEAISRATAATGVALAAQSTEAEKLAEKMAAIGPAGREFVRFLQSIRPELQGLQDIAQANMFPGLQDGIESLLTILPRFERLVGNTAAALGTLAREGGDALTDPFWRSFFDYLANEVDDIILDFGRGLGNIAEGFAGMMVALDPLADDFRESFLGMSGDFSEWGRTLSKNEGYKEFVEYVRRVSPQVWDTLGAVADALLALAEAAAPIGEVSLPIIEALADGFAMIMRTPAGPALVGAATGLALINRTIRVADAAKYSRLGMLIGQLGVNADGSRSKLRKFGGFLGGPWGVAIGLGVTALAGFIGGQKEAEAQVDELRESLNKQTGAITNLTFETQKKKLLDEGALETAKRLGLNLRDVTLASLGNTDALKRLRTAQEAAKRATEDADRQNRRATTGILGGTEALRGQDVQIGVLIHSLVGEAEKLAEARRQQRLLNEAGERGSVVSRALSGDTDLTRRQLGELAEQLGLNRQETQRLIDKYNNVPKNVDTDANFRDKDAREKTREFKRFVKEQLQAIEDEEVRVTIGVGVLSLKDPNQHIRDALKPKGGAGPIGGGAALPAKAMAGAMGGPRLTPNAIGSTKDMLAATDVIRSQARNSAQTRAGAIEDILREQQANLGPSGKAGRVLPKGSYRIGMPYLGYPGHYGADYPAPKGTPVYAPYPGRVTATYDLPGSNPYNSTPYRSYGRVVRMDFNNGLSMLAAHLSQRIGSTGPVAAGEMIGRVGTTGNSTGDHLHAEFYRHGATLNPATLGLFDRGGRWRSGTGGMNLSGKDELVLTNEQAKAIFPNFDRAGGGDTAAPDYSSYAAVAPRQVGPSLGDIAQVIGSGSDAPQIVAAIRTLGDRVAAIATEQTQRRIEAERHR
jgi:hypothetical protein